jgi:hypothetical protein
LYSQNISITKVDIDRVFSYSVNAKLFDNSVFSVNDTLLVKRNNYIVSRLSKFQGATLSITKVNNVYVGRIFKSNSVYYELKVGGTAGTYSFVMLNANGVESGLPIDNSIAKVKNYVQQSSKASASLFTYSDLLKINNEFLAQDAVEKYNSYGIPVDNDLALVQSGWGCIFLDIDGAYVNSSMWNFGQPFTCVPPAFASDPNSVDYVKNRVKQLFYPFSVVVTTDSTVYIAAQPGRKIPIIITPTSAWYPGVSAISYVTSFTWGDDTPAFVFSDRLGNNLKSISFASGRTPAQSMGLYGQAKYDSTTCTLTQGQSNGFGTGETAWSPLMGSNSLKNVYTFANGPTPNGCTFRQDNIEVITTQNGLPNGGYRFTAVPQNNASFNGSRGQGIGEKSIFQPNFLPVTNDSVSFKIVIGKSGVTTIIATPLSDGPGNDGARMKLEARLYDLNGNVVAQTDPLVNSLSGTISQAITPGTYYLIVRKGELPQTSAPAFFISRGYGQYGWFTVTVD